MRELSPAEFSLYNAVLAMHLRKNSGESISTPSAHALKPAQHKKLKSVQRQNLKYDNQS